MGTMSRPGTSQPPRPSPQPVQEEIVEEKVEFEEQENIGVEKEKEEIKE